MSPSGTQKPSGNSSRGGSAPRGRNLTSPSQLVTSQPSGPSLHGLQKQREENDSSHMDIDESGYGERLPTAEEMARLPDEDKITFNDDYLPLEPSSSSAFPGQLSFSSPAMEQALSAIQTEPNPRRLRRNEKPRLASSIEPLRRLIAESKRQVNSANAAETATVATTGQAPFNTSRISQSNKVRTDLPESEPMVMDMRQERPAKNQPPGFGGLLEVDNVWCAVQIDKKPIMGNPFGSHAGYGIKLNLDPGVHGQPSLGLDFMFSKDGTTSTDKEKYNSFAVGWEPGVTIGDNWMMDGFLHQRAVTGGTDSELVTYPDYIQQVCKQRDPKDSEKLVFVMFKSNVHKSSKMDVDWAKALPGYSGRIPYANLQRMYKDEDPTYWVIIWFKNPYAGYEWLDNGCLTPLSVAVNEPREQEQVELSTRYAKSALGTPPVASPNTTELKRSAAELEVLRLKNRQTLHRLAPF